MENTKSKHVDAAPSVFIVILNWNGWQDTIECLETLLHLEYSNYQIILVDNGSENDSIKQIISWANGDIKVSPGFGSGTTSSKPIPVFSYSRETAETGGTDAVERELESLPSNKKLVLIENKENLGFAGGCNTGIRYALATGADYVWLLNNDTAVLSDSLSKLVEFLESHGDYNVVTGQIRYYDRPDIIWNCGGMLTWYGCRKYDYVDSAVTAAPETGFKRITYITGCAALYRTKLFKDIGILSEDFFFGEEDFEMALRTNKYGCNMQACVYDSIIYHKVGASIGKASKGKRPRQAVCTLS